jgi:hypothetical protein
MYAPWADTQIQDAGYAESLDAIDYAPGTGWSPSGTAELIIGHCYVVRLGDGPLAHYAKFRVTNLSARQVELDWAYQIAPDNRELRARRVGAPHPRTRRPLSLG